MRGIASVILVTQGNLTQAGKAKAGRLPGRQAGNRRQAGRQAEAGKAHILSLFLPKASEPPSDHLPQTTFPIIPRIGVVLHEAQRTYH